MDLVEFDELDEVEGETVPTHASVVFGAIVGIHLGAAIFLLAACAGAVELLRHVFGPSLEVLARTAGLG